MIVVTGGAGFIGSVFVATLNKRGISDITIVDEMGTTEKWKNLVGKQYREYYHKDTFLNLVETGTIPFTPSAIVHLGACSDTTERNVDYLMENNVAYSQKLAEYAAGKGIRFIYASSAATYGDGSKGYLDDESNLLSLEPLNPYGFSKHTFDLWVSSHGLLPATAGIKFFNVFGPNEYHKGFTASLIGKAVTEIESTGGVSLFKSYRPEFSNGEQKRDFVYVKDCCDALYWFLENPKTCGIFNLGTGTAQSWNSLARAVFAALKREAKIKYIEMPDSIKNQYQYFTAARMEKLRAAGYDKPFLSLDESVADYVCGHLKSGRAFV